MTQATLTLTDERKKFIYEQIWSAICKNELEYQIVYPNTGRYVSEDGHVFYQENIEGSYGNACFEVNIDGWIVTMTVILDIDWDCRGEIDGVDAAEAVDVRIYNEDESDYFECDDIDFSKLFKTK